MRFLTFVKIACSKSRTPYACDNLMRQNDKGLTFVKITCLQQNYEDVIVVKICSKISILCCEIFMIYSIASLRLPQDTKARLVYSLAYQGS